MPAAIRLWNKITTVNEISYVSMTNSSCAQPMPENELKHSDLIENIVAGIKTRRSSPKTGSLATSKKVIKIFN